MTIAPKIDVRDLRSVRKAVGADVVLGDEYVSPETTLDRELVDRRRRRGFITLNRSPLARKIITFNLLSIVVMIAGVLWMNPSRENLAFQRASGMVNEAELIADVFETRLPAGPVATLSAVDDLNVEAVVAGLDLSGGVNVLVYGADGQMLVSAAAAGAGRAVGLSPVTDGGTLITDFLNGLWEGLARLLAPTTARVGEGSPAELAQAVVQRALDQGTVFAENYNAMGQTVFTVATPVQHNGQPIGVVVLVGQAGELDALIRSEREQVLQMFVIGVVVSIAFSLVLASTIANPLSDLAAAAELGRDRNARKMSPGRVRIPDLTARPDEIGRLSGALRGMVAALYDRIEANEQFAADVSHEIKNPLASLRSAVGTMRIAKREDQREKLLELIEHDVIRLDRLVSDISSASRLDSELVREEEQQFDLLKMLGNLNEFLGAQAKQKKVDYLTDMPVGPILFSGLEGRLAQVFVNLITNAISFCEEGDAIRVWVRRKENRVLVVVEDTGPGIPEEALTKIFKRFYSQRPPGQFGNNSGLGLAISKQIVEAHGGVIWAENIRPTDADPASDPLGARFVVGLPL